MKIGLVSGSSRLNSSNSKLLGVLPTLTTQHEFYSYPKLAKLPVFSTGLDQHPWPTEVLHWRTFVANSDAIIISTPEYLHNLPAQIKNALEWLTTSGELNEKRVLAITFTPNPPRGEKALESLLWSLTALEARVVATLPLYQNEISFGKEGNIIEVDVRKLLLKSINELKGM